MYSLIKFSSFSEICFSIIPYNLQHVSPYLKFGHLLLLSLTITVYHTELSRILQIMQVIQKGGYLKNQTKKSITRLAYSLDEAAQMLGVSKGHLQNENMRGKLNFLKSGRRTLVTAQEIQRYLSELA